MNLKVNEGGKVDKKLRRRILLKILKEIFEVLEGFEGF